MMFPSQALKHVTVLAVIVVIAIHPTSANDTAHDIRRLTISPDQSIAIEVQNAHNFGANNIFGNDEKPRYKLHAEKSWGTGDFFINVKEATPAITPATTTSTNDGPKHRVNGDHMATLLVADTDSVEDRNTIAMIAVDRRTGNVNGIVNKENGEKVNFFQEKGNKSEVVKAAKFVPPEWKCGNDSAKTANSLDAASFDHSRHLLGGHDHNNHHHHHDHSKQYDQDDIDMAEIKHNLRNSNIRLGKRRSLQATSGYKFQVNMYIEIDFVLCTRHGESCANGVGPKTLNYINVLFAGANSVYEAEIDTHLNILHVAVNSNYDSFIDTGDALDRVQAIYGKTTWHFPNTDLHHAVLGRNMGGGIAWMGVLCNPSYGFGLSSGMRGNYSQMGNAVVWDFSVFMHEVGHNFGSGHTHDSGTGGYSPLVDTCGNSCPAALPLAKSTTLMSYCDLCSGGMSNMAYTFGGRYNGSGDRKLASSYTNSVIPGVSTEPRRVNVVMYSHVASRPNNCLAVPTNPSITRSPTQKPTTSKPTTRAPTSKPTTAVTPTTRSPTSKPTTAKPNTRSPTSKPTTQSPTSKPTTVAKPTSRSPTSTPTTAKPTTRSPTQKPTSSSPTQKPSLSPTDSPSPFYALPTYFPTYG